MTTLQIEHLTGGGAKEEPRKRIRMSWSIARGAIRSLSDAARSEHTLSIEAMLREDGIVDEVKILVDGMSVANIPSQDTRGAWTRDEHSLLLVRIVEDGIDTPLLDLTLETTGETAHVLYARTTILHSLGISGGRYELSGAELVSESKQ